MRVPGPGVFVPAAVADVIAPWLRAQLRQLEGQVGRQEATLQATAAIVGELEAEAARWRRGLSMSASGSASGHFRAGGGDLADPPSRDGWLGIGEAAEALGVTGRHVRRLADAGLLVSWRPGRERLIAVESIEALRARKEST